MVALLAQRDGMHIQLVAARVWFGLRPTVGSIPRSRFQVSGRARIQDTGRMVFAQSAKDGTKPRSSRTCCSPTHRNGNDPSSRKRKR
jgi:hypothetical protein